MKARATEDGASSFLVDLFNPSNLWCQSADIYVSDEFTQRISIFNSSGVFQSTFSAGSFPTTATGVALDSAGNVYVSDSGNQRIRNLQPQERLLPHGAIVEPGTDSSARRKAWPLTHPIMFTWYSYV